jgi:hypothetical protein
VHGAVLAASKQDQDALKAKCFALIMTGRHAEALKVARLPQMVNCLHLERAYCIWKAIGTNAALAELGEAAGEGEQHLKALLLMRVGQADKALKILEGLLQGAKGDKQATCELVCNMLRAVAALIIEPLGVFFLKGKDPRIIDTSLLFPPTILDPSGSIFSNATVCDVYYFFFHL